MTITAKIIADSISPQGHRLTTMQLRYPRFIHAEFMTHRVFSRNASSSRAVPVERMIQEVLDDPAMPVQWGSEKKGMQAGEELPQQLRELAERSWLKARDEAVDRARDFIAYGAHKQIVNRLLEPFAHINVICTATEWDNFFKLRCHPDADPTMRTLAEEMRDVREKSVPNHTNWHLPYIGFCENDWAESEYDAVDGFELFKNLAMVSAARCARVSYLNHDSTSPDIEKDLALAQKLRASGHMSPFEHQARVGNKVLGYRNFRGWEQHRAMIEDR